MYELPGMPGYGKGVVGDENVLGCCVHLLVTCFLDGWCQLVPVGLQSTEGLQTRGAANKWLVDLVISYTFLHLTISTLISSFNLEVDVAGHRFHG